MESIDNYLTFEVKKEIAERYFGFRKIIEEDTSTYLNNVLETSHELETSIGHDLIRIYTLLDNESLIFDFLKETGLPERFFFDSYINTLPKKDGIFAQQKFRGITRKGCLHNMFFDTYDRLCQHIQKYRRTFEKLQEDHETICQQINIFYRKNDIETIFHFLRSLDTSSIAHSAVSVNTPLKGDLENKLRILPPPAVDELLPSLPEIPTPGKIRRKLKSLVTEACQRQPLLDLRSLKKNKT